MKKKFLPLTHSESAGIRTVPKKERNKEKELELIWSNEKKCPHEGKK